MATAKKATAKKATATKATATKASASRSTAKKATAKKATAKKSTAKAASASKSTAKKASAKKSSAKESRAKESRAKESSAKESTAKKASASRSTAKKASAKKSKQPAESPPRGLAGKAIAAFERILGDLPADLAALLEHAASRRDDAFFTSPTYGELTLSAAPAGANHYVDAADGEAWSLFFRDVAWIGEEADGGLVGYDRRGGALDQILFLDNEGSLQISGRSLIDHFAWRAAFDGEGTHPELDAFCDAAGLPRAGAPEVRAAALAGLDDPSARLDRLIAATRAAQGPAERPVDRWPTTAKLSDGRWLVISNEDDVTRPRSYDAHVAFAYVPALGRFTRLPDTPIRGYLSLRALAPLADGRSPLLSLGDEVKIAFLDPASDTWSRGASLARVHDGGAAILLGDGRIAVIGGGSSGGAGGHVDLYDPKQDRWEPGQAMPTPRRDFGALRLADGRVLAVGGSTYGYRDVAVTELYDPRTNTWSTSAPLPAKHASVAVLGLADGRVLLTRGDELALFDPRAGRWGPMKAREGAAQAMVSLAEGGVAFFDRTRVARFDPASGAIALVGATALTRNDATRGLELADGRILLVGGDLYNNIASEPELWDPRSGEGSPLPGFERAFERQRKALAKRRG